MNLLRMLSTIPMRRHASPSYVVSRICRGACVLLGALVIGACGDSEEGPGAALTAADYVPEDTIVFSGGAVPMPIEELRAVLQAFNVDGAYAQGTAGGLGAANKKSIMKALEDTDSPALKFLAGLYLVYLDGFADPDGFIKAFGLGESFDFAAYTVGLVPVVRFRVQDPGALEATIQRIEGEVGVTAKTGEVVGTAVRRYPLSAAPDEEPADLLFAVHDGYAVFTVEASFVDEKTLEQALGVARPKASLAESGKLEAIVESHGILPKYLGFIDHVGIVRGLTSPDANSFGRMLAAIRSKADTGVSPFMDQIQSDACRRELGAIAERWPQTAMGYTVFDVQNKPVVFEVVAVVESKDEEFMQGLRSLRGVIAPSSQQAALFDWSFGVDMDALMPFVNATWQSIVAQQYACGPLAQMRASMEMTNPAMMGMALAFVSGVKGISISVLDLEMDAGTSPGKPSVKKLDGMVTLAASNPNSLYMTAAAMVPALQGVEPPVDGKTVDMPALVPGMDVASKLAIKKHHVVWYSGERAAELAEGLDAASLEPNGFMSFRMDYQRYVELMLQAMDATPALDGQLSDEDRAALQNLTAFKATMLVALDFVPNGISMRTRLEMH